MRAGIFAARALASAGGARGEIVSVFSLGANLLLDGGALVSLLRTGAPFHSWALEIEAFNSGFDNIKPGLECQLDGGAIWLGDNKVPLAQIEIQDLTLESSRPGAIPPDMPGRLSLLNSILDIPLNHSGVSDHAAGGAGEIQVREKIETILSPLHKARIHRLARSRPIQEAPAAIRTNAPRGEIEFIPADLANLIGLGPGLTPSGDDILVGLLAALDCFGAERIARLRKQVAAPIPQSLAELSRRTPRQSAQMLHAAAAGHYPEPLVFWACEFRKTDFDAAVFRRALDGVLKLGAHSGHDFAEGLCLGIAAILAFVE